jgi:hypothetical protein
VPCGWQTRAGACLPGHQITDSVTTDIVIADVVIAGVVTADTIAIRTGLARGAVIAA